MPSFDLILSGINLMLIGMGVVFSFLIMLVFSMFGMSRLAMLADKQTETHESKPITPVVQSSVGARAEMVAVITAAIARFRTTHG